MQEKRSQAELLACLSASQRREVLKGLTDAECEALQWDWQFWGRPEQILPDAYWFVWLILAGRGWGKTRTAVENIAELLRGSTPFTAPPGAPGLLSIVADSPFDMRQYSIDGPSGFLHVGPPEYRPLYEPSKKTLTWPNGAKALLFSAEDPETLRGASGSFFWWDELAKSRYAEEGWSNMLFGMREGNPRGIVTTTPRPTKLIKELRARKSTNLTVGSTWDNRANLSPIFYTEVIEPLIGTRKGRQEIDAEILDDVPGALWTRAMIDAALISKDKVPDLQQVSVAIDPSGTDGDEEADNDDVGIVAAGKGVDGHAYVLADRTCNLSPAGWARRAVDTYKDVEADRIVAEVNYGGAMVEAVIRTADPKVPFRIVHASRGKVARAEPVAALYEQGKIHHVGSFGALEDEMCAFTRDGYVGDRSPNRADALVWVLTDLMLGKSVGSTGKKTLRGGWF